MIDALPLLLSDDGYNISRSVRLRSSASAYFSRTLTTPTNNKIWTWSAWVKRGRASGTSASAMTLFATGSASTDAATTELRFDNERLVLSGFSTNWLISNAVYRDPSAWYHIVVAWDNSNATASNRIKIYVNGLEISYATDNRTSLSTTATYGINQAVLHTLGAWSWNNGSFAQPQYYDGYFTEINFIDGQALTPSSFGETNPVTGVWQPKRYTGTYGTNGFFLNFSDPSAATAAAIGKDYSGNGNNWTPNNISVTAGATYDSMLDVPTLWADGGNGRGNYCTLNPLVTSALSGGGTLSNGNLRIAGTVSVSNAYARGTMALSGKFYAEFFFDVVNATASIGVDVVTATTGALNTSNTNVSYRSGGNRRVLGTESAYGASWVANDIIGVAVDTAANTVEFFKNGVSQGVITSSAFFAQGDCVFAMAKDDIGSPTGFANFGQRPFAYTPPSGFKALNTLNLPTPTILKGNQYFDVTIYTGSTGTNNIVNSGGMQPDLVWVKNRQQLYAHYLFDAVRGTGAKALSSNNTNAEGADGTAITSFNSNGFTFTGNSGANDPSFANANVGWQWKEGATQGFDIVTYTGDGTSGRNISHSLGVAPAMMIVKNRSSGTEPWRIYHKNMAASPATVAMNFDTGAASASSTRWNNTAPTSSVFTVGNDASVNANTNNFVAYLFAPVAGFSAMGSYTGNGSADGPFVFCGFRPRYVMIKGSSFVSNWFVIDTSRSPVNVSLDALRPNLSDAETSTGTYSIDILSNGFKLRSSAADANTNGATFIWAAFAEVPFRNALAR